MPRVDLSQYACSIARTLDVVGDKWSLLVLRDALYGLRRFEEFVGDLGIARNVLSDRLSRLVEHGVLSKEAYEERPPRFEYRLTEKGRELLPVVLAMMRWGDRWAWVGEERPAVTLVHDTCGQATTAVPACEACGERLELGGIHLDPVPPAVVAAVDARRLARTAPGRSVQEARAER